MIMWHALSKEKLLWKFEMPGLVFDCSMFIESHGTVTVTVTIKLTRKKSNSKFTA